MPKITIEIDEEIYKFLQKQAISFEEKEPNDVLRRLLLKKDIENKNQDPKVFVRKSEINFRNYNPNKGMAPGRRRIPEFLVLRIWQLGANRNSALNCSSRGKGFITV